MIPGQRFQPLDLETNLGLVDPFKVNSSEILNLATNQLAEVTSGLDDFIKSIKQSVGNPLGDLTSLLDKGIRSTRDAFSAMADISKFSPRDIESAIADMLPGDKTLQNVFKNVTAQCRNKGMSGMGGFRPYKDSFGCGTPGGGKCSSSQMSGLLDKLTGGAYSSVGRSLNSMLKSVMALGNMGYDAGLCKIFGELVKGMPSGIVQRGAAGLLALTGKAGNTSGVMDIASSMGNVIPSLEIPALVGMATSNFKTPMNFIKNSFPDLTDGYMTALDSIQPAWNKSDDGSMFSTKALGKERSGDLMGVLDATCSRGTFDVADLGSVGSVNPIEMFSAGYKTTKTVKSALSSFF